MEFFLNIYSLIFHSGQLCTKTFRLVIVFHALIYSSIYQFPLLEFQVVDPLVSMLVAYSTSSKVLSPDNFAEVKLNVVLLCFVLKSIQQMIRVM